MQIRYLGDSHDCIKYALLRHLVRETGLSLGVNWYMTDPAEVDVRGNNHGEKRHHLNGGRWEVLDAPLLAQLTRFEDPAERTLAVLQTSGILPADSRFFGDMLRRGDREAWHHRARAALQPADLIFLDPDRGFQVKSMTGGTAPKYAFYAEFQDYIDAGKPVVSIQFARQCDPVERADTIYQHLRAMMPGADILPVVRGRVAPNILFFTAAPKGQGARLEPALRSFVSQHQSKITRGNPLVELVGG